MPTALTLKQDRFWGALNLKERQTNPSLFIRLPKDPIPDDSFDMPDEQEDPRDCFWGEEFTTSSSVVPAQAQGRFSGSKRACPAYQAHH